MHFDLLLRGGMAADHRRVAKADVGIVGGRIEAIGDLGGADAADVVDVAGLTILPGIIDSQVHFREPGMEHKEDLESGTRAAVAGGVTTVLEMPNTSPPTITAEALADKIRRADGRAWCNIGFFVGAALDNLDRLAQLERLPGTPGVKLFMGSSTGPLLVPDDEHVFKVLQSGEYRVVVHSEDSSRLEARKGRLSSPPVPADHPIVRDAECARLCTERLLRLAAEARRPVHVLHISTADEIPLIEGARASGVDVTAEITPQHLWFSAPEAYEKLETRVQMNPPIRDEDHRHALREAVRRGFFTVFGSDHAPHTLEEKSQLYPASPSGMPGVQTLFPAMATLASLYGLAELPDLVRMGCLMPARMYGLASKGRLEVGCDADLAVFDLRGSWRFERESVQSKCGWSPFEGETFTARAVHTVVGGRFAWREGAIVGEPRGRIAEFSAERLAGP